MRRPHRAAIGDKLAALQCNLCKKVFRITAESNLQNAISELWPERYDIDKLPIIPHEVVEPERDCCGCLVVYLYGNFVQIVCNECSKVLRKVPIGEIEAAMADLGKTETFSSATCPHCGAVKTVPYFQTVFAFICSEYGLGVNLEEEGRVQ